jgi:hypothetical protein
MPTPNPKTPPHEQATIHRGAQPDNSNAARHNIYSSRFSDDEITRIIQSAYGDLSLTDEIGLARVTLDRCFAAMDAIAADPEQLGAIAKIVLEGTSRVANLMRQQKILTGAATDNLLDTLASAIDQARDILGAT